jgi:ABC-type Na+ efflux pump permease subunit
MKRLPLLRLFVAYGMGMLSLAGSFNPNFLRTNVASWNPFVHLFVALFGAAWFIQAAFIHKQIRDQRG